MYTRRLFRFLGAAMLAALFFNATLASAQSVNCTDAALDNAVVACRRVCPADQFCVGQTTQQCFTAHPVECGQFVGSDGASLARRACFLQASVHSFCAYALRPVAMPCTPTAPTVTPVARGALPLATIVHRTGTPHTTPVPAPTHHAAAPTTTHHASTTPRRSGGGSTAPVVIRLPRAPHGAASGGFVDAVAPSEAGICPEGMVLVMADPPTNTGTAHVAGCLPPVMASMFQSVLNGVVVNGAHIRDVASAIAQMHTDISSALATAMNAVNARVVEEALIRVRMCADTRHRLNNDRDDHMCELAFASRDSNHQHPCLHQCEALQTAQSLHTVLPIRQLPASISGILQNAQHAFIQCTPNEDGSGCETQASAMGAAITQANAYGQRRLSHTTSFTTAPPTF